MQIHYISNTAQEYCTLPDPRQPQQAALFGYLLVEGPLDGTGLTRFVEQATVRADIETRKQAERAREAERFEEYVREQPDYIVSQFERQSTKPKRLSTGPEPLSEDYSRLDAFREFCAEKAQSSYRNDNGEWVEAKIHRVAAASLDITEAFDYLGRWHDKTVRLVVDPDPDELAGYEDITDVVMNEANELLPASFLEDEESVLTPDFVVTDSDDGGDNGGDDVDEAGAFTGGENENAILSQE
jgi:hypothetical protein